jgi:hypothetical protein
MAKKKKTAKERHEEELRRAAEESPRFKHLLEVYERGMAELEAKQKIDPNYR